MYEVYDEIQDLVIYTVDTRDQAMNAMLYYLGMSRGDYYSQGVDNDIYIRITNGKTL